MQRLAIVSDHSAVGQSGAHTWGGSPHLFCLPRSPILAATEESILREVARLAQTRARLGSLDCATPGLTCVVEATGMGWLVVAVLREIDGVVVQGGRDEFEFCSPCLCGRLPGACEFDHAAVDMDENSERVTDDMTSEGSVPGAWGDWLRTARWGSPWDNSRFQSRGNGSSWNMKHV